MRSYVWTKTYPIAKSLMHTNQNPLPMIRMVRPELYVNTKHDYVEYPTFNYERHLYKWYSDLLSSLTWCWTRLARVAPPATPTKDDIIEEQQKVKRKGNGRTGANSLTKWAPSFTMSAKRRHCLLLLSKSHLICK